MFKAFAVAEEDVMVVDEALPHSKRSGDLSRYLPQFALVHT